MLDQKQIIEAIAEDLTLSAADIDPESSLQDDLGLNLIEVADLVHNLSVQLHISFETSEITNIKTVGDLVESIEDKLLE